ncbi:hypothetical protein RVR_3279 [Actinacidiphila reveromycinica]|uniref:Integral membrane protein n=1 Tax=Actinacidiphila reveromycinica TaxID=659352 RepID=A0A7U3URW1_9ACTN|nr:hypothetical protein [Streptomyces sp. SN-593]BBA97501.1 hypothetical protein RVR_3279 [Streptomyces sp. SN-593]
MARMPALRLVRSAVFAAVCTAMSGLGHAMMSGAGVPVWALLYAFAGVTALAWWAFGRRRGAPVILGGSLATQLGLHCVFLLGQWVGAAPSAVPDPAMPATSSMPPMPSMPSMPFMPGMGMAAPGPGGTGSMAGPGGGMAMHEWSPGMLLLHAAAALVCGLWMWRGEVALHRMIRSLAWVLAAPLRYVLAVCGITLPPLPRVRAGTVPPLRPAEVLLRHAVVRRGPPPLVVLI